VARLLSGIGMRTRTEERHQEPVGNASAHKASVKSVHKLFQIKLATGAAAPWYVPSTKVFTRLMTVFTQWKAG
jgi:hypothetical protein